MSCHVMSHNLTSIHYSTLFTTDKLITTTDKNHNTDNITTLCETYP